MFAFDNVNGALAHAVEFGATIALNEDGATCVTAWCFDPDETGVKRTLMS